MTMHEDTRAPFTAQPTKSDKRLAGRTDASATQLEIRAHGDEIDATLREWVHERIGRQLGKFATSIERIDVRFGDENGPKGGHDKVCQIHLVLSKLPPVIVEQRGDTEREAFDLAAARAERATRRNLEKHGYSTKHHKHKEHVQTPLDGMSAQSDGAHEDADVDTIDDDEPSDNQPLLGRREGHRMEQIEALSNRPEKERRDVGVDTSLPGVSADDRKVGADHTALRNTKLNTEGMTYSLEDSTTGKPSRKSTRGGTSHGKNDSGLTRRTKDAVHSPKQEHARAATRGH